MSSVAGDLIADSAWRRRRLLILCYHGVSLSDEHEWSDLYISPQQFEDRLAMLRSSRATILPLEDALIRLRSESLPQRAVALTFDDGAYDFYKVAYPMLTQFRMPATLYLTTWYCGQRVPVFNPAVSYLMWKGRGRSIRLPGSDVTIQLPENQRDPRFTALHRRVLEFVHTQRVSADAQLDLLRDLSGRVGVDFDAFLDLRLLQIMDQAEVRALDPALIDVQLHTHRHRSPRQEPAFLRELEDNRRMIASITGDARQRHHFCYPSGDYDSQQLDWLSRAQILSATTCDPGLASPAHNPFLLPRFIDTGAVPADVFRGWVHGVSALLSASRSAVPRSNAGGR